MVMSEAERKVHTAALNAPDVVQYVHRKFGSESAPVILADAMIISHVMLESATEPGKDDTNKEFYEALIAHINYRYQSFKKHLAKENKGDR